MDDFPLGSPEAKLAADLYAILRRDYLRGETSALIKQEDARALVWFMAVSTGMLGVLLATISRPQELHDSKSLSQRITDGGSAQAGRWQYEFTPTRFPVDGSITFALKVYLPIEDLAEVVQRLNGSRS